MKIGIGSQNFRSISGHAGKTRRFLIFETQADGTVPMVERLDLPKSLSLHEFRGDQHPLFELDALITGGCGQGFVRRLAGHGVRVIATSETDPNVAAEACAQGRELPPALPHEHKEHEHKGHDTAQPPKVQLRSNS